MKILTFLSKWESRSILAVGSPKTTIRSIEEIPEFTCIGDLARKWQDGLVGRFFFYFFRLLRGLLGICVSWFGQIRRRVDSVGSPEVLFLYIC